MSWLSDGAIDRLRSAAREPDLSGTRYDLIAEVGRGGMSTVFAAEDRTLRRRVALKVLDVLDERGDLAERLTREARILARLEHPGIVPVHDVGRLADGRVFYAMKYVAGLRLDAFASSDASLTDRLRTFQRIADAVAFAHDRGVLHRDLKPENVMVGSFGEVLVMDWGLAKVLAGGGEPEAPEALLRDGGSSIHTGHGAVLGTPGYMAPEQERGEIDRLDARTDVYALGALLRFLLSPPQSDGRSSPPQAVLAICDMATAASPADRYSSVLEMSEEVSRFLDGRRVEAHPEGLAAKLARVYVRHQIAFWLIVAYLVVRGSVLFFTGR